MLTQYTIEGFENIQYQGFQALTQIRDRLGELFHLSGYQPVSTPTFENYDFFTSEEGLPGTSLFKLIDCQGKVLALKPDATMQIARMAAINHRDPEEVIKFYYSTKLYRHFSAPDSVKKETTQMGIEYFGNASPECDGEVIALAIRALLDCGITDIRIDLGHVGFINQLLKDVPLSDTERAELLKLIETKNTGDIREFLNCRAIDASYKAIILKLPRLYGDPEMVLSAMQDLCINDGMKAVLDELKTIYGHLESLGFSRYITFDIGFTSQMNYYTDLIFKAYIKDWGEPIIGGGRYNKLSSRFGIDRPACGFGIDMLQMIDYLDQHHLLPEYQPQRVVILYDAKEMKRCDQTVSALHTQHICAEMFMHCESAKDQIKKLLLNPMYRSAVFYLMTDEGDYYWDQEKASAEAIPSVIERAVKA